MRKLISFLTIILCWVCTVQAQDKKVATDTLIMRNDSVFMVKQEVKYEFIGDTTEMHQRILQIDEIISVFEDEQAKLREQISFFKASKEEFMRVPVKKKPVKVKKQPASVPKKKN